MPYKSLFFFFYKIPGILFVSTFIVALLGGYIPTYSWILPFMEITLLLLLLFSFLKEFSNNRGIVLLTLPFNILHIWAILSVIYIEYGAYIPEEYDYGKHTGATLRLIASMSVFYYGFFLFQNSRGAFPHIVENTKNYYFQKKSLFLTNLCNIGLIFGFVLYKSLPLLSADRFSYFDNSPAFVKLIFLSHGLIGLLNGLVYGQTTERKRVIPFILFIILIVLSGDKFSAIFWAILAFYAGYAIVRFKIVNNSIFIKKVATFFIYIFVVLLIIVSIGYLLMHSANLDSLFDLIISRALSLQGHVWYGVDLIHKNGHLSVYPWGDVFYSTSDAFPKGIDLLMYDVTDQKFAEAMLQQGVTFTMGFPAILLHYFPNSFYVILFLFGLLFRFIVEKVLLSINKLSFINICLLYSLFFIVCDVFIMGRLWKLFTGKILFLIALLLFWNTFKLVYVEKTKVKY